LISFSGNLLEAIISQQNVPSVGSQRAQVEPESTAKLRQTARLHAMTGQPMIVSWESCVGLRWVMKGKVQHLHV
jgi:hypothetical protein